MAKLYCEPEFLTQYPTVEFVCKALADALGEPEVHLLEGTSSQFDIRFDDNTSWFRLDNLDWRSDMPNLIHCSLELVVGGNGVWYKDIHESKPSLVGLFSMCATNGFRAGQSLHEWCDTACEPQGSALEDNDILQDDANSFGDDSSGQGGDSAFSTMHHAPAVRAVWFGQDEDECLEQENKFTSELNKPQESIVPDGITRIRVVALKYQSQVIGYRFKTDVGAFDMKQSVALGHGLGGFKTETFIALESVGGLLMSSTERKHNACVPDVSECQADCEKLIKAVFSVG